MLVVHIHAVLTHNMLAPVSVWAGLSIAFGQGAAVGGGAGSFLGPVTVVGGIVIGGLAGLAVHSLWRSNFKYSLTFNAPGICEYKLKSNDAVYVDADTCYFKPREHVGGAMVTSITENSNDIGFSRSFSSVAPQGYNTSFKASAAGKLKGANEVQGAHVGISSPPLPNPPENDDDKDKEYFTNQQKIKISRDDIPHIFENRPGHLPDSLENRQLLVDLVLDENNFIGLDKYGTKWYAQITTQGKQLWAVVRNGLIRNGGINNIPRNFNGKTGLSRLLES